VRELKYGVIKEAAKRQYVSQLFLADGAAGAGHKAEALTYLERAYEERQPLMVRLLHNPELDSLREEPRFKAGPAPTIPELSRFPAKRHTGHLELEFADLP